MEEILLLNKFFSDCRYVQCYIDVACCYRQSIVVCLLVCLSQSLVSPAKTAKPIEMPFVMLSRVDPRKHVLDGVQFPTREGAVLKRGGESGQPRTSGSRYIQCDSAGRYTGTVRMPVGMY